MKKIIAVLIAFMILVMCSSCSNQKESSNSADSGEVEPAAKKKIPVFSSVAVGDVITFGHYEQDNNLYNGPEAIDWLVLDVQEGKALLMSKYGLDVKPYNTEKVDITWEECSLRSWLNNDFMNTAFSLEEQSVILTTELDNTATPGYDERTTFGGNNTKDKLFLLSFVEANKYLGLTDVHEDLVSLRVAPTAYAIANGAGVDEERYWLTEDGDPTGGWELRSPGSKQYYVIGVNGAGSICYYNVNENYTVNRPAFWLKLD